MKYKRVTRIFFALGVFGVGNGGRLAGVGRREILHFVLENEHGLVFYPNLAYKNTKEGTEFNMK